jgi:hypothetical protein
VRTTPSLKELDFERHVVCHKRPLQPTSSQLRTLDPSSLLNSALELSQLLRTIWSSLLSLWVVEGGPFGMESPPCCPSIFHVLVKVVIVTMGFHDGVSMLTLTAEGEGLPHGVLLLSFQRSPPENGSVGLELYSSHSERFGLVSIS